MAAEVQATTETSPQTEPQTLSAIKQRIIDAVGVLATAVAVALYRSDRLSTPLFSLQIVSTVAGLSIAPALYRGTALQRLPAFLRRPLILTWGVSSLVPCVFILINDLFTGHLRPDGQPLDAMWRIFAILGLWIGFAVVNERYIRPWWRRESEHWFGGFRNQSIAAQNQKRTMDRRTTALEGIKARVVIMLQRKTRTQKMIEKRNADVTEATSGVREAEDLLEKAHLTANACNTDEAADEAQKKNAVDKVDRMIELVRSAKLHERSVKTDIDRCKAELEGVEDDLKMVQHEWTTALHIDHHAEFAR